jgi:arylsulfatase A-like enzyme
MDSRPNILLLMPDQMRGDCLSLERHPVLTTPNMDEIGGQGIHFTRAYTTCASCIPARRSLLTGQFPTTNGLVGFEDGHPIQAPTLPSELRRHGYATALIGRHMHQFPYAEPYGYDVQRLGSTYVPDDDYARHLDREAPGLGGVRGLGVSFNGWQARPWPLPEPLHPTNWVTREAREHMASASTDKPLFLTVSYYAPHPPLIPPPCYLDRYLSLDLPGSAIGDWAVPPPNDGLGLGVDAHHTGLRGEALRHAQAGYFGLIHHLDDQLYWLMAEFRHRSARMKRPWVIALTSDHGEMLGDHYYFRKCEPYEGSARIPLLVRGSHELGFAAGTRCHRPVCLEDLMPTVLDLAGTPLPPGMDGVSLLPVLRGDSTVVRRDLHGEHSPCYDAEQAYHMLTDGTWKYVWRPTSGIEQLFNLDRDPRELHDLSVDPGYATTLTDWRGRLVERLRHRPEGFVHDNRLVPGRPYPASR